MCGKDTSPSPFIPLYSTVAVDKATESSPTQAESDIELAKSRYCDAATRTLPTSIFDLDLPLVTTREENEFRLAMMEKMRQAAYRGIEAEFKLPFFSTRMAVDSEGSGEVGEGEKVDDATKVANVSEVKPAGNEELGIKAESSMSTHHDFHPPAKFVRPKWLADVERAGLEFTERMRGIAELTCRKFFDAIDKAMENVEIPASNGSDSVESRDSDVDDIPDAEHPYMDETSPFSPAGQDKELPVDYRYRPTERQWQVHDFPCPWGGTLPPPMPPAGSEAMPSTESPVARDELDARIGALEFRFDELLKGVKAYNEKIADLISDVEMLKANSGSGPYS
jgi:hypothetical protein